MLAIHLVCWLFAFFLGAAISADDAKLPSIGDIFRISKGKESGNCDGYTQKLNLYFKESRIFSNALDQAADVVSTQEGLNAWIVQKLLTSWFGIRFDANTGEVMKEDFLAWQIFRGKIPALHYQKLASEEISNY